MAYAISTGHSPALSPAEWNATSNFFDSFGAASTFPSSLRKYPVLQNAAHGQNFQHFWMYSALAAPGLALARLLGLNANWGFVLVNLLLYLLAAWLALRRLGLAGTWFLFLSPVIWWLDKAVTEAYTFSLLSIAFLLLEEAPWWSLLCLGFAADQNPPIALVIPIVFIAALLRDRSRLRNRKMWIGTAGAVLIAIVHPIFYETQLGVITPQSLTTVHWQIPSLAIVLAPITDLNIGLLVDFPLFIVGLVVATGLVLRRRWRDLVTPEAGAAIVAAVIFLLSFAEGTQVNSGGTPSLDRYDLWLVPLLIPVLLICFRQDPQRMFRWFMPVAVLSSVLSLAAYQMSKPDDGETHRATWPRMSGPMIRGWTIQSRECSSVAKLTRRFPSVRLERPPAQRSCSSTAIAPTRARLVGSLRVFVCAHQRRSVTQTRRSHRSPAELDAVTVLWFGLDPPATPWSTQSSLLLSRYFALLPGAKRPLGTQRLRSIR